jgi:hypothetical protein
MDALISVETKIGTTTFHSIDSIPSEVVIHAHDSLNDLEKALADLKCPDRVRMGGGTTCVRPNVHASMRICKVDRAKFFDFVDTYGKCLAENMKNNPQSYAGTFKDTFETTFRAMQNAILKGTFNKDSESFKQTCKALKIKHTYKAIDEFIGRVK